MMTPRFASIASVLRRCHGLAARTHLLDRGGLPRASAVMTLLLAATISAGVAAAQAQGTFALTTIRQFSVNQPVAGLALGSDGNFYGSTYGGGQYAKGTLFRVTSTGALTTLYNFGSTLTEGYGPRAALTQGSDGNFYGTASFGGTAGGGTVFKVTPAGVLTTLHNFAGGSAEGENPQAVLLLAADGNFYGTTFGGGKNAKGTVFRITPAGALTTLYSFDAANGDGATNALAQGADGNFYGVTGSGGANAEGSIFRLTPAGAATTLHSFGGAATEGTYPYGGLVLGNDGNFYGTTAAGGTSTNIADGSYGAGTFFRITPAGVFGTLFNFNTTNGAEPLAALVKGSNGNFYGSTEEGGANGLGTIFEATPAGTVNTLHSFAQGGTEGLYPAAPLLAGRDGNFYGTVPSGVSGGAGTVFSITPGGTLRTLHNFNITDGYSPQGTLLQGANGDFYGTTQIGGTHGDGTVYRLTSSGTLTTLHSFGDASTDGAEPQTGLEKAADGNFYGTTVFNIDLAATGTFYRITPSGTLTTLAAFNQGGAAGTLPKYPPVQGRDGNFYGQTIAGALNGFGTIYRSTPGGTISVLHENSGTDGDGLAPSPLVLGSDGNFYGTADKTQGIVYRFTPEGVRTELYTFRFSTGADGLFPVPSLALVPGSDGFYGLAGGGGTHGAGTVYRITTTGALTTLYSFGSASTDGTGPNGLILGSDGSFYGTTSDGGVNGGGTIFRVTASGTLATLYSFGRTTSEGNAPKGLVQGSDGGFYGVTAGGSYGHGTIFRFGPPPPRPTITSPTAATATQGSTFSYQITATNGPTSYGESALPAGLTIDQKTGKISGTPQTAGTFSVTIAAFNSSGSGTAKLSLTVKAAPPAITSATTATATQGTAFNYQITATNSPTKYGESGLPGGLSIDQTTGKISGTPTAAGTFTVTIAAFNSVGSGSAKLTLTVKGAVPKITSATTAGATVGKAFAYQITATNSPTKYGESGIPAGLKINQATGLITGTPAKAGAYNVTIAAFNGSGSGTATLTLTVAPQ